MKRFLTPLFLIGLCAIFTTEAGAIGDTRLRMKIKKEDVTKANQVAILSFCGNSVVTGNMGMGSLVTGLLSAQKESGSGKVALDEEFMGREYDTFAKTLTNEGYKFVPVENVVKSSAYQQATAIELPSYKNAKGLKNVNANKTDALKKIAAELNADVLFFVTSGHSLGMRDNIGTIAGKNIGIATTMITVYNAQGKKLGYIDASDVSDQKIAAAAGGFSDPNKVMPLLQEADSKLVSKLAAAMSKKG